MASRVALEPTTSARDAKAWRKWLEEGRKRGTWAAAKVKRPDHPSELLRAVLASQPRAAAAWAALSPAQQRLFNLWVNEAAREETRQRRAQQVLVRVLAGRRAGI